MESWLTQNWLALLGAVTGSFALLINYLSYRHSRKKEHISLVLSCAAHHQQVENLRTLEETKNKEAWHGPSMVEFYTVTVRNSGSINAPLAKVGVVTQSGTERTAHVVKGQYMEESSTSNIEALPPKSERNFNIFLNRGEEPYAVSKAFVIDQTGKRWEVKA